LKGITTISQLDRFDWRMRELKKIAKSLHHLDECSCNYGLTPRQETRETNLEKKAEEIAKEMGLILYRQGDPRGCSLYLLENEEDRDSYSTKGLAIY